MATFALLVATVLAAGPMESTASARELRDAVSDALRREAITEGTEHSRALRDLTALYNSLQADSQLPLDERRVRLAQVRNRLDKEADKLERQAAKRPGNRPAAKAVQRGPRGAQPGQANVRRAAGNPASGAAAGRASDADEAQDLVDLIQNTIAPDSWEQRGGRGTIRYFPPKQVLVIRQSGEVHEEFEDLMRQLRR